MKVQTVNINIPNNHLNKHKQYLYNNVMDFVSEVKVGGVFSNQGIKLDNVPETAFKILQDAKIFFEKVVKQG